ncbi:glycoside hydrolase family 26 protein [Sphingomonas japonica]|uniref:Mannan endo-1,4-beta-mannosidase n=1 Tax=Sphingomonas japonica TaxID=511662 RepID=A0ABX0U0G2_9SPHN|nr:glycosyl hydrolase [Sphingomonas japonica]NIJ22882.1 mannan endo-1,4-beta-mannosidase [Sphingomonas japonica]
MSKFPLLVACASLAGCAALPPVATARSSPDPVDRQATVETRALLHSMAALAPTATMFGHQNTLAYGYRWRGEPDRSDVKDVAGCFPAVYGWDLMDIFARNGAMQVDPAGAQRLRDYIRQGFARGGVITLSWHQGNPANDGDAWNVDLPAVARILPGGDLHSKYMARLDVAADFIAGLEAADGTPIPVVFRPYHEHTGSWFWWGRDHATPAEFKGLWRMTVEHLRDRRGLRNVLYSYSTDVFDSEAEYLERYPGDDVIDVLGFDDYHSIKSAETTDVFRNRLRLLVGMARERGKIAALTETGLEAIPDPDWWTSVLLAGINADAETRGIAWALVWRNATVAVEGREHFYAPYPGQASAADFKTFADDPSILLECELPDLYARGNQ